MRHARLVCRRFRMAVLTRHYLVIRRIDVAIGTYRAIVRNPEPRVVEDRAQPCRGYISGVAGDASRPVIRRDVVRRARAVSLRIRVVILMAAVAIRRWIPGGVVTADMTIGTRIHHGPNRAGNRRARRQHVRPL